MSEIDLEAKAVDIQSAKLWLSHDRQDKFTKYFGKHLCDEVERLRARVKELERAVDITLNCDAMIKERNKG